MVLQAPGPDRRAGTESRHMNTGTVLTLFATIFVLALLSSSSAMIVAARSVASGFLHGVMATLGIVAGDTLFILLLCLAWQCLPKQRATCLSW